jgi:hypothetical protein
MGGGGPPITPPTNTKINFDLGVKRVYKKKKKVFFKNK